MDFNQYADHVGASQERDQNSNADSVEFKFDGDREPMHLKDFGYAHQHQHLLPTDYNLASRDADQPANPATGLLHKGGARNQDKEKNYFGGSDHPGNDYFNY